MQTLGVGVDIIENSRIKKSIKNKKFLSRIFSKIEIINSKIWIGTFLVVLGGIAVVMS